MFVDVKSAWSEWSGWSTMCGVGSRNRTRSVVSLALNGGAECGVLNDNEEKSWTKETQGNKCAVDCEVVSDLWIVKLRVVQYLIGYCVMRWNYRRGLVV